MSKPHKKMNTISFFWNHDYNGPKLLFSNFESNFSLKVGSFKNSKLLNMSAGNPFWSIIANFCDNYGTKSLDTNECASNNGRGPCDHFCINTYGSYQCKCRSGFTARENTCTGTKFTFFHFLFFTLYVKYTLFPGLEIELHGRNRTDRPFSILW